MYEYIQPCLHLNLFFLLYRYIHVSLSLDQTPYHHLPPTRTLLLYAALKLSRLGRYPAWRARRVPAAALCFGFGFALRFALALLEDDAPLVPMMRGKSACLCWWDAAKEYLPVPAAAFCALLIAPLRPVMLFVRMLGYLGVYIR